MTGLMQTACKPQAMTHPPKHKDYMLKRWASLGRYAHTSHLPIDNNLGERVICPSHEIERRTIMSGYVTWSSKTGHFS